jgi:hypothetical protein
VIEDNNAVFAEKVYAKVDAVNDRVADLKKELATKVTIK